MRHPLRRVAALLIAFGGLFLAIDPAGAVALQGANRFQNAPLLPNGTGVYRGTTVGATLQPGEPSPTGNDGGASVWYSWRPTSSGTVRMTTRGSDFDTLLGVYRGATLQGLLLVKGNDDTPEGDFLWSRVQFQAQAGITYRIQIDGYNESGSETPPPVERGEYVLRITEL